MVIQHNMMAFNANRQYGINIGKSRKLTEKLSSGYKINRAADDAAGLAISEKMRRMIRGLGQSAENIQDGIGFVQTADGALNEAHDILQRMNELAIKSANGTNMEEDRQYIDSEIQQLKTELDRIFSTTTFNDKKIWDPNNGGRKKVGEEMKQAVSFTMGQSQIDITNKNCGVIAANYYQLLADDDGVSVKWRGFDGNDYEIRKIDWGTLKAKDYAFEMSDYFENPDNTVNDKLFDTATGDPLFTKKITFSVQETATLEDMIASINQVYMSASVYTPMVGEFEDGGAGLVCNASINYGAAYASNVNGTPGVYDFDNSDDLFMEAADADGDVLTNGSTKGNVIGIPTARDAVSAGGSGDKWEMSFYMDGIGKVTGTSVSVTYWAQGVGNWKSEEKDLWWYQSDYDGKNYTKHRTIGTGTLGDVMSVLTGKWEDAVNSDKTTPGLLTSAQGGSAKNGGYIEINFQLTSDNEFSYGGTDVNYVGSYKLRIAVQAGDTEQDVLDRIHNALNDQTVLDFKKDGGKSDFHELYTPSANDRQIQVPIWGGTNQFFVQAGTEGGQHISVDYECLNVAAMKMQHTNVLTVEDSEKAINEIKSALQMVSTQRSDFGAYQNRLEHAVNANENTEENTQAAESVIRDTDMAKSMVEYSNNNILLQAGQAMLAQANQSNQAILSLLQ